MARTFWIPALTGTAAVAYGIHGLVTETGLAGWINYLQQAIFGSYSTKLTVVALTLAAIVVVWLSASLAAIGSPSVSPSAAAPVARPTPDTGKATSFGPLAIVFGAMILVTWAIGFGSYWWSTRTDRLDAAATYEPISVSDATPTPVATSTHVALTGRLLSEKTLEFSKGKGASSRSQYQLVPLTSPGWKPGQPVGFVIKVKRLEELGLGSPAGVPRWRLAGPSGPTMWLGRLDGEVPVTAAQIFAKEGAPLAPGAQLVQFLPSENGRPAITDRSADDFQLMLILCGGISALLALMLPVILWSSRRQERRRANGLAA